MLPPDVMQLVRQFANNSYRYLFRQPDNVAELLRWRDREALTQRVLTASDWLSLFAKS